MPTTLGAVYALVPEVKRLSGEVIVVDNALDDASTVIAPTDSSLTPLDL